ncbi:MAG: hypothetical protein HYZ38_16440 [Mycobacterium sp.]|nr:hypothetical protein [Mycobacterium sp.]
MSTPRSRARLLRGALVGVSAAIVTIGAHAAAGGALPQGGALILSVLVCGSVGAVLAGISLESRGLRYAGVTGALLLAQALGHLTLSLTSHHPETLLATPLMIGAHIAGAALLGAAIATVEHLYTVCASLLCWLRLLITVGPRTGPRPTRMFADDVVAQSVLRCSGLGMRAPPLRAALTA